MLNDIANDEDPKRIKNSFVNKNSAVIRGSIDFRNGNVKRTAKARSSLEFRYLNFVRGSVRIIFEQISWIASGKKDSHPMLCVRDFLSIHQVQRREMHEHKNFFY